MSGKHSKSFFDFRKSASVTTQSPDATAVKSLALPLRIIVAVLVASLLMSAIFIGKYFFDGVAHKDLLSDARRVFRSLPSEQGIAKLAKDNKDIKGWLKIDGTEIDCAVCHGEDDAFYLNHNQLGKKSRHGALFLSSSDTFERKGNDKNIVIFGNNMSDGTMFGSLKEYRKLKFYKQNPFVNLYYADKKETYVVFAVMVLDDVKDSYSPAQSGFKNEDDFNNWYLESCKRSLIDSTVSVKYGDEFLTLVTSAKDFEGARLVVIARKTDENEIDTINVAASTINSNIKYPEKWYEEHKTN